MSDHDQRGGLSVNVMAIGIIILCAFFCWALAASAYLGEFFDMQEASRSGRRAGVTFLVMQTMSFLINSARFDQLPGILGNALTQDRWIVWLFLILESLAVGFWLFVRKLEAELAGPQRKRRKRKRKRRRPE